MKLSLQPTTDATAISQMAHLIWRIHYPPIIGAEQTEYMLRQLYSVANQEHLMEEGQQFYFIMNDKERLGFISFTPKEPGLFFLNKWYLLPECQGKGIGGMAFQLVKQEMTGMKSIRLTVNRQNFRAINFYFKLGFCIEEVKDFDIGDGYFMNDFIMKYSMG